MRTHITEAAKVHDLIDYIKGHYAVEAEIVHCEENRWHRITLTQGGKTFYSPIVADDNDAAETQCRLIRHELERMIEECELPILFKGAA